MINVTLLKKLAVKKEKENYKFRNYLKEHADEKELDEQFKKLHNKYFKIYDCNKCRNCCRKLGISMNEIELENICDYLKLDKIKFKEERLNESYGEYSFKNKMCEFLDKCNNCIIKDCLPKTCKEYPYTNKEERLFSLYTVINNASICPVVYEILEELKEIYNFKK